MTTTFSTVYQQYKSDSTKWISCDPKGTPQCIPKEDGRGLLKGQLNFLHSLGYGPQAYFAVTRAIDRIASEAIAEEIKKVSSPLIKKMTSGDLSGISVMTPNEYLDIAPVLKRIKEIDIQKKELMQLLEERFSKNTKVKILIVIYHLFSATINLIKSQLSQKSEPTIDCNLTSFTNTYSHYKTVESSTWLNVGPEGEISCVSKEEEKKKLRAWSKWLHFFGLGSMGYLTLYLAVNRCASKIFVQTYANLPKETLSKLSNQLTAGEVLKNTDVQAAFKNFIETEKQRRAFLQLIDDRFLKHSPISKFILPQFQTIGWLILFFERLMDRSKPTADDPRTIQAFTSFSKPQLERALMEEYATPFPLWSDDKIKILYSLSTQTPGYYYQKLTIQQDDFTIGEVSFYADGKKLFVSSYQNDDKPAAEAPFEGLPFFSMLPKELAAALQQAQPSAPSTNTRQPIAKGFLAHFLNQLKEKGKFEQIDDTKFTDQKILEGNSYSPSSNVKVEKQDTLQRFITEAQFLDLLKGLIPIEPVLDALKSYENS